MIVAAVALVFALVGTAVAGPDAINRAVTKSTVKKIAKKQAKKQLRKNISGSHVNLADQATTADTANRANRADTADTATSADTANTANTATSADTANTANTATNADNAANAAALNGLSANQIRPLGRQAENTGCDPQTTTFVDCASVDLNLPSSGRVLLIADITWHSDVSPARGLCRLTVNGPQIGDTAFPGENLNVTDSIHEIGQGLNAVTGVLSPGVNAFRLQCNQEQGDIDYDEAWLSAVYIGAA